MIPWTNYAHHAECASRQVTRALIIAPRVKRLTGT